MNRKTEKNYRRILINGNSFLLGYRSISNQDWKDALYSARSIASRARFPSYNDYRDPKKFPYSIGAKFKGESLYCTIDIRKLSVCHELYGTFALHRSWNRNYPDGYIGSYSVNMSTFERF